jgi:hypothetical protein
VMIAALVDDMAQAVGIDGAVALQATAHGLEEASKVLGHPRVLALNVRPVNISNCHRRSLPARMRIIGRICRPTSRSPGPLGGIGRRSGFKIRNPKGCSGSSPEGATEIYREKATSAGSTPLLASPLPRSFRRAIADVEAPGVRCIYRSVVVRSECPASSWIARAGAPLMAR